MNKKWHEDIWDMHYKFGVHQWIMENIDNKELMTKFLEFRLQFLQEELDETRAAAVVDGNPQEIVDGLIDLCVVAIGTLDAFGVDPQVAWDEVHKANMSKEAGVKELVLHHLVPVPDNFILKRRFQQSSGSCRPRI